MIELRSHFNPFTHKKFRIIQISKDYKNIFFIKICKKSKAILGYVSTTKGSHHSVKGTCYTIEETKKKEKDTDFFYELNENAG